MNMVSKSKNLDHVTKLLQHAENCMHHNKYEMNDDLHEREYLRMGLNYHKTKLKDYKFKLTLKWQMNFVSCLSSENGSCNLGFVKNIIFQLKRS